MKCKKASWIDQLAFFDAPARKAEPRNDESLPNIIDRLKVLASLWGFEPQYQP